MTVIAPVNLSIDLANSVAVKTTAALRYADHHLNASSFLTQDDKNVELYCVAQACITFPIANLKERLQQTTRTSSSEIPVASEMWVKGSGRTAISFGHVIIFEGEMLAAMTRVFVRKNVKTGVLVQVSERERSELFPSLPRRHVELPEVTQLHVPSETNMQPLFGIRIGPQHCNNDHVDHAALADLLLQGLFIRGYFYESKKLYVRYLAPVELDQTLTVCVHKDRPLAALYRHGSPLVLGEVEVARRSKL